jgi:hypothetical protein
MNLVLTGRAIDPSTGASVIRASLERRLNALGWTISNEVTSYTDALVAGEDAIAKNTSTLFSRLEAAENSRAGIMRGHPSREPPTFALAPRPSGRFMLGPDWKSFAQARLYELPDFDDLEFDMVNLWDARGGLGLQWRREGNVYSYGHSASPADRNLNWDKAELMAFIDTVRLAWNAANRPAPEVPVFQSRPVKRKIL